MPVGDISARLDAELQVLLGTPGPPGAPPAAAGPAPAAVAAPAVPAVAARAPDTRDAPGAAAVPAGRVPGGGAPGTEAVPGPAAVPAAPAGPAPAGDPAASVNPPPVLPVVPVVPEPVGRPGRRRRVAAPAPARRPLAQVSAVALGVLVLAAGIPAVTGRTAPLRTVTIRVGAQDLTLTTRASRVGALLAEAGVRLGPGDRVRPAPGRPLHSGTVVRVTRAFPVTVELDGLAQRVRTTARTVAGLRRELGVPAEMVALAGPGRLRADSRVVLRTPHRARIRVDGTTRAVRTAALDVAGLLAAAGVRLGPHDEVTPPLGTPVHDGLAVTVARVGFEDRIEEVALAAPVVVRDDPGLPIGQERVVQAGTPGRARQTWRLRLRDGQVVDRTLVGTVTLVAPLARIVARGTRRAAPVPAPPGPGTGARARGTATWYAAPAGTCAHLTLPFGTIVTLRNPRTGATARCRVADRGPQSWTGHIIDLSPDVFRALAPLGQGVVAVELSW